MAAPRGPQGGVGTTTFPHLQTILFFKFMAWSLDHQKKSHENMGPSLYLNFPNVKSGFGKCPMNRRFVSHHFFKSICWRWNIPCIWVINSKLGHLPTNFPWNYQTFTNLFTNHLPTYLPTIYQPFTNHLPTIYQPLSSATCPDWSNVVQGSLGWLGGRPSRAWWLCTEAFANHLRCHGLNGDAMKKMMVNDGDLMVI